MVFLFIVKRIKCNEIGTFMKENIAISKVKHNTFIIVISKVEYSIRVSQGCIIF